MENELVPDILKVFIKELVKPPMKQTTITQRLLSSARPRTVTPLIFGLAVSFDNCLESKWMMNLLQKLGFSASYNEFRRFTSRSFTKGNLAKNFFLGNFVIVKLYSSEYTISS